MNTISRRRFVGSATLGALALTQAGQILTAADTSPGRKIKMGLIGCGWYGMVDVDAAFKAGGVEVIALCDVDSEHLTKSADKVEKIQGKRPQTFKNYEDLLKTPGLEAVIIGAPPHWHALMFIAALEHGLDVYCEKPLAYDIREGRAMVDAAKKSDRIVQVGFQRRQNPAFKAVKKHIADGNAGKILCAEAQIHYNANPGDARQQDPPASLDWEAWCGPAPRIPYSPQVGHMSWRLEKTTGHGHLVDWGIHLIDATRVMLGLKMPKAVQASGGIFAFKDKITTPDVLTATFEFDELPLTWRHRIWGAEEFDPERTNGVYLYGEKETIFVTDDRWTVIPRGNPKDKQEHKDGGDSGLAHMVDFLDAVRTRRQPICQIEDAFCSTASVQLAMIAYESGSRILWDAASEQITNSPEACKLLKRDYRAPWKHPGKA